MDREWLSRLYNHMEWADSAVWDEVLSHQPAASDPFVEESLLHLHSVQWAYLTGWRGGTPERATRDQFESLEAIREWGRAFYPEARAFLAATDAEALADKGDVLWPELIERAIGRPPIPISLADMVYQVASHSGHHRAQVNRRIRELGGSPPFIDYVAWAWLGDPGPGG